VTFVKTPFGNKTTQSIIPKIGVVANIPVKINLATGIFEL
jgi:hypothetical protein